MGKFERLKPIRKAWVKRKIKAYRTRLKKGDFWSHFLATPDAILKIAQNHHQQ